MTNNVVKLFSGEMCLVCPDCGSQTWYIIFNEDCSEVDRLECGGKIGDDECPAFIKLPDVLKEPP